MHGPEILLPIVFFVLLAGTIIAVVGIVNWASVRKAEMVHQLKVEMVQRGYAVEKIAALVNQKIDPKSVEASYPTKPPVAA